MGECRFGEVGVEGRRAVVLHHAAAAAGGVGLLRTNSVATRVLPTLWFPSGIASASTRGCARKVLRKELLQDTGCCGAAIPCRSGYVVTSRFSNKLCEDVGHAGGAPFERKC
jgi:hypothetical protein